MIILKDLYEKLTNKPAPYYYNYSLWRIICKPIRKWLTNTVASSCPFNCIRILIYRMCGFNIGKHVFIGMHCYLDDMCYDLMTIGNNVIISYGVYFTCHGKNLGHYKIVIDDNAYIGMRASIISKNAEGGENGVTVGKGATVGACALVNRNIPDGMTAVGVPCRILAKEEKRFDE